MQKDLMRRRRTATFKVEALNSARLSNPFKEFVNWSGSVESISGAAMLEALGRGSGSLEIHRLHDLLV